MPDKHTGKTCFICGKPAVCFVTIKDASKNYKYAECFRCEVHKTRAEELFKKVYITPLDEALKGKKNGKSRK
jgi:transcription elongation factor Elf1